MDIASLLAGQVPTYFIVGPLIVLALVLLGLFMKKSSQSAPSPQQVAPTPQTAPLASPTVLTPGTQVPPPPSTPVGNAVANMEVKKETAPQGQIPPTSAWKPLETPQATSVGQSEAELQAQAKQEATMATMEPSFKPDPGMTQTTKEPQAVVSTQPTQPVPAQQPVAQAQGAPQQVQTPPVTQQPQTQPQSQASAPVTNPVA